ncbi:hypothetical protein [Schumannella sp. 10F1B-5-1]|uniref:hypothetical protein n=1 Tax=Schumannella sp. 10F1B-5-1 TaxID=2590780 RepID=UPI001131627D|nr:hypothetical protein [Schumannella sp. 10F1B-5-1]
MSTRPVIRASRAPFVVGWITFAILAALVIGALWFDYQSAYWAAQSAQDPNSFSEAQRFWATAEAARPAREALTVLVPVVLVALLAGHAVVWNGARRTAQAAHPSDPDVSAP